MTVYELNMDGLVGPTHNYAGLSTGNIASTQNAQSISNPKAAALQGIAKMRLLLKLGLIQGILPPQQRPNLKLLARLGFSGTPEKQIAKVYKTAPELLSACYSASCMWTANAATVSPSSDTANQKLHFTAANLITNLHRYQEAEFSKAVLEYIFSYPDYFSHHKVLPRTCTTSDEGAANHNRLCKTHADKGVHLFVYGKKALGTNEHHSEPIKYPARQTLEASATIARNHQLNPDKVVFAKQNPLAIDQGVFHNDVISVANESVFLVHQEAFHNQQIILNKLRDKSDFYLNIIEISKEELSIKDAVSTYLFNSQLITIPNQNKMVLIAPIECSSNIQVKACIDRLINDSKNPITQVQYLDLKQSMRNGGGPACLRLRVPINEKELKAMHQPVLASENLLLTLEEWVKKHYRSELKAEDLIDPSLIDESSRALDELTQILRLGSIYSFQKEFE